MAGGAWLVAGAWGAARCGVRRVHSTQVLALAWCTVHAVRLRAYLLRPRARCGSKSCFTFKYRARVFAQRILPRAKIGSLPLGPYSHKASTVHHHAIVHGVVRKPRYQGVRGHSLTRAASRGLCAHHQAIVRAPDGLSYQVWQSSTIRQPRASLNSARSCASDMRRGPGPKESSCIPCARYSDVWLHHVKLAV